MKPILVVNTGSSSLKYQLIDVESCEALNSGLIERVTDHSAAFAEMLSALRGASPVAVGRRVVHGGDKFSKPTLVTRAVLDVIDSLAPLAPLHNPGNVAGIRAAIEAFPDLPQYAIFDTAFHQSMPASSYRYAISAELERNFAIRRYGFHGTSFSFVSRQAAAMLGKPISELNAVLLHLGSGASACAIKQGKSFDTSMGLTPLQGLVMGTRSGDIDPAIVAYLERVAGMNIDLVDHSLNKDSGLKGMTGDADLRDVTARAAAGDLVAEEALEVYAQRVKHYIGAYIAEVGPVDCVVFTAGVGENSSSMRRRILKGLEHLGIELDSVENETPSREAREISSSGSRVKVLVIPTNEELEIALQVESCLSETR